MKLLSTGGLRAAILVAVGATTQGVAYGATSVTGYGAGGAGLFTSAARAGDTILSGSDVGGLYLSADAGKTWSNVTSSVLASNEVHDVRVETAGTSFLIASTAGVHRYTLGAGLAALGSLGAASEHGSETFPNSTQTVALGPSGSGYVWAGMGRSTKPWERTSSTGSKGRTDSYPVYLSTDNGATFVAASGGLPAGLTVYKLEAHPATKTKAWAATNAGLYFTSDAGASWTEVGQTGCTSMPSGKPASSYSTTYKGLCLPPTADVRDVEYDVDNKKLYVTVWEGTNYASSAAVSCTSLSSSCSSSTSRYNDTTLTYYRGGLYHGSWYSTTTSTSFTWRTPTSGIADVYVACGASAPSDDDWECVLKDQVTNFHQVEVSTVSSSPYALVGGYGRTSITGLYTVPVTSGAWTRHDANGHTDDGDVDGIVGSGRQGPPMQSLVATDSSTPMSALLATSRGILSATYSSSAYQFDHLGHTYDGATGNYASTGLDATTVAGVARLGGYDFLAGRDSVFYVSPDSGSSWKHMEDVFSGFSVGKHAYQLELSADETTVYLLAGDDQSSATLYAYTTSGGWSSLASPTSGSATLTINQFATTEFATTKLRNPLLVATSAGVYQLQSSTWVLLNPSGCPTGNITSIHWNASTAAFAYVIANETDVYEVNVKASTPSCTTVATGLTNAKAVGTVYSGSGYRPTVLVGSECSNRPCVSSYSYASKTWSAGGSTTLSSEGTRTEVAAITRHCSDSTKAIIGLTGATYGDGYVPTSLYQASLSSGTVSTSAVSATIPVPRLLAVQCVDGTPMLSTRGAGAVSVAGL